MKWVAALVAVSACTPPFPTAEWQPAADRNPELAIESSLEPATARLGSELRVVTYNVEFGSKVSELATLFAAPPFDVADVFLLQEIEAHPGEGGSRASRIAAETGMAFAYLPSRGDGDTNHGIAILSRRPLANLRFVDLPSFNTSIRTDGRVALAAEINAGGEAVDIVNVHLRLQLSITERIIQLMPATEDLAPLAVIGGDLNTNPYAWSDMLPIVATEPITDISVPDVVDNAMAELGYAAATKHSGPTHQSAVAELRLDSIYARGFQPDGATVERSVSLSDHWPLWVDLER